MSAIGKGDWVECVDASPCPVTGDTLILGALYIVREVMMGRRADGLDGPGIRLRGVRRKLHPSHIEYSWKIERFRPIYRPKADLIEALKQPSPELEDV